MGEREHKAPHHRLWDTATPCPAIKSHSRRSPLRRMLSSSWQRDVRCGEASVQGPPPSRSRSTPPAVGGKHQHPWVPPLVLGTPMGTALCTAAGWVSGAAGGARHPGRMGPTAAALGANSEKLPRSPKQVQQRGCKHPVTAGPVGPAKPAQRGARSPGEGCGRRRVPAGGRHAHL